MKSQRIRLKRRDLATKGRPSAICNYSSQQNCKRKITSCSREKKPSLTIEPSFSLKNMRIWRRVFGGKNPCADLLLGFPGFNRTPFSFGLIGERKNSTRFRAFTSGSNTRLHYDWLKFMDMVRELEPGENLEAAKTARLWHLDTSVPAFAYFLPYTASCPASTSKVYGA